jgi:hypothetical protein
MKLCKLLHETTGKCPTCGGKVTSTGISPESLIFPDKEGRWIDPDTGEVLHQVDPSGASEAERHRAAEAETQQLNAQAKPLSTPQKRRRKRRMPGMMQALLRYRKELADQKQG